MKSYNIVVTFLLALTLSQNVYANKFDNEATALYYCMRMGNVTEASVNSVKGGFSFDRQRKSLILDNELSPGKLEQALNAINYAEKNIDLFYDLDVGSTSSIATYKCMKDVFIGESI